MTGSQTKLSFLFPCNIFLSPYGKTIVSFPGMLDNHPPQDKKLASLSLLPLEVRSTVLLHLLFLKYPGILRFQQVQGLNSASGSETCDLGTAQPWLCIIGRIASPPEGPCEMWVWACWYFLWYPVHGPGHLYSALFPSQRMNKSFICDHVVHTRHVSPENPSLVYLDSQTSWPGDYDQTDIRLWQ